MPLVTMPTKQKGDVSAGFRLGSAGRWLGSPGPPTGIRTPGTLSENGGEPRGSEELEAYKEAANRVRPSHILTFSTREGELCSWRLHSELKRSLQTEFVAFLTLRRQTQAFASDATDTVNQWIVGPFHSSTRDT